LARWRSKPVRSFRALWYSQQMANLLLMHSGLRFLVLVSGVVALSLCAMAQIQGQGLTKAARISCSVFIGSLHLQVVLGLVMVAMGTWYPKLAGHLAMMLLAAVLAQALILKNKRSAKPGSTLPLIAVGVALVLVVGGILAIGRNPLSSALFTNHAG
jgi:heme A synthase